MNSNREKTVAEARSTGTTMGPEFHSGQGPWLHTHDGTAWFDATSGSGAATLGHQHPAVVAAATAQLGRLVHTGCKLGSDARADLIRRLGGLSPYRSPAVLPTVTGSEAVESALKIARAATGHRAVVGFTHGYHGKTTGALGLTWRAEFRQYSALASDAVVTASLPELRHPEAVGPDDTAAFLSGLEAALDQADRLGGTAAVVLEPVQVTEGVLIVPPALLDEIARAAHARGALLVLDEIYTALGRAGRMFTAELMSETPDLTLVGKTLGNGFPIGAVVGEREVLDALPAGVQTSTFSGSPMSCAAAAAVLETVEAEDLPARARALGALLADDLARLAKAFPWVGRVRAAGALAAFDCVLDGRPHPGLARTVREAALRGRLLLFGGGPEDATIKIVPPALLAESDYRALITGLTAAIGEADRDLPATVRAADAGAGIRR
ncbi:aspartate aminotransferase family protein [Streptomyces sp. NPDC086554]|uniref:aspartate aminotransferase family protein n=1 Tax=Streptomyces sp. NPDC086554 TaxID=3154864 RepID=UPI0034247763